MKMYGGRIYCTSLSVNFNVNLQFTFINLPTVCYCEVGLFLTRTHIYSDFIFAKLHKYILPKYIVCEPG
jgi:hypothetical protein